MDENTDFFSCPSSDPDSDDSFSSLPNLCDSIGSFFDDVPKNFNVIHINAQSIPAHFTDMLASFDNLNIHAILVSESWLKPSLSSISFSLPGFQLIRNDRTSCGGGGVAIYLRNYISFSILSVSAQPPPHHAGEHLFIEVMLSHTKFLLGVYYCPSLHINFFSSFEALLDNLCPSYSHSIIMGDFNTCLLKQDSRSTNFKSIVRSSNLSILHLNATHNFPNATPSLLDLIIVSDPDFVYKHGQCAADLFSYHDLIYLSYKLRPPKSKRKVLLQRNIGGIDIESLRSDAKKLNWEDVILSESVDKKVETFNCLLTDLYNKHAPFRPVKMKHLPAPWLTPEIRTLIQRKQVAKAKYKHNPTELNKDNYIRQRNRCNKVCRKAQRQHIQDSVQNEDPAKVWKFLRSLGVGKCREDTLPKNLNLDSLNQHFSSVTKFTGADKIATISHLSNVSTPDNAPFSFNQFTDSDVKKSISSISSNAVGSDSVSRKMVLLILDEILPVICHILNASISQTTFPMLWKEAQIIPLPKKSNPSNFSDYRPISILPFLSKVLERLVHTQLNRYLVNNSLLNPFQSGFRRGHSTVSALVNITEDIRRGMECGNVTVLSLLDFSNAFNNVDFDILLAILRSLNISPTAIEWFRSYLYGRRQRIRLGDIFSAYQDTHAGVPQGGVLSPLLFATFINSISIKLSSSYHLYADDLQIYTQASVDHIQTAADIINRDLQIISNWSRSYGIKVNPEKTQTIIIGSSRMISRLDWLHLPQFVFDGTTIPVSNTVKNLGIFFDKHLSWENQIVELSRKMYASAASLKRLRNMLPISTKIALAQSLLLPLLDYADVSYPDLTEEQLNKLERLQNFCIRFIFGLRKYDHVSEFRKKLKWLPIRLRRNTHILSFLYSILFNPSSPIYLRERLEFLHQTHSLSLRSSDTLLLKMPSHSTQFTDNSFTVQAVRLWNNLPVTIRQAKSVTSFKLMVKNLFLDNDN